jgi:hypothetical protein
MSQEASKGPRELSGWMTVEELRMRIFAAKEKARADRAAQGIDQKFAVLEQMREMAEIARASRNVKS